jgi:hypothetical protein
MILFHQNVYLTAVSLYQKVLALFLPQRTPLLNWQPFPFCDLYLDRSLNPALERFPFATGWKRWLSKQKLIWRLVVLHCRRRRLAAPLQCSLRLALPWI